MMNEVNVVPQAETTETTKLQVAPPSLNREALVISLLIEKRLPAPQKEFPVSKWTMPPEQQGYIHGNDNDCL